MLSPWYRTARWGSIMIIGALLLVPLARIVQYSDRISTLPSLQVDAATYDRIGADLAGRWTFDAIPPLQPPGFVTLLALVFTVFGHSWTAAKVMLWLVLVCVTVMAGWLARRMYESELAGWLAALLCASSPVLGWYAQTVQYELVAALFVIGLITIVTTLPRGFWGRGMWQAVWIGVIAGAAGLMREVLIVLVPIVALAVGQRVRKIEGARSGWIASVVLVAVALSLPLAWSTFQSTRIGRAVTLSDKGPLVLAFGNNPHANGTFNAGLAGVGEPSGLAFIRAEPAQALRLAFRKVLYFWGALRDGWNVPRPSAIWAARALGGVVPLEYVLPWARGGCLLALLIIAVARWPRQRWRTWWMVPAAVALVMSVHILTVSSHRFAVPIVPLVLVMSAGPIASWLDAVARRPVLRAIAVTGVLAIVAMQWLSSPLIYRLQAAEMDGVLADSVHDESGGGLVRVADVAHGPRPMVLLVDELLPAGAFDVRLTMRSDDASPSDDRIAFRLTVTTLGGDDACTHDVPLSKLARTFSMLTFPCALDDSGPVTLIVQTSAIAELRVSDLVLAW